MADKPTPQEVDAFIMSRLPSSFMEIAVKAPGGYLGDWYRPIDRGLQRLRKRGVIEWNRAGGVIVWSKVDG